MLTINQKILSSQEQYSASQIGFAYMLCGVLLLIGTGIGFMGQQDIADFGSLSTSFSLVGFIIVCVGLLFLSANMVAMLFEFGKRLISK